MKLEKMDAFFTARVESYDRHMLTNVEGCGEGYRRMAALLPPGTKTLLDLGCGTGLELDEIFITHPCVRVTGIDLTQAMLTKLREKHPGKDLKLVCASYFDVGFGTEAHDACVSFQTMHHFTHEAKATLYQRIHSALNPGGVYLECDYMVAEQEEEDIGFAECERLCREAGAADGAFYHCDTPCTVGNQVRLLQNAGFLSVEAVWRQGSTTLVVARK